MTRNNISEVAYNVQTVVDAKHNIPIDFKVTNENDSKAMGGMLRRTKTILGHTNFMGIYDKGYHTGSEFDYANRLGIAGAFVFTKNVLSFRKSQSAFIGNGRLARGHYITY
jgi:hypothetical protein